MALRNLLEDPSLQLQKELSPIEKDPRFLQLLKDYKYKVQSAKGIYASQLTAILSLLTGPLHAINTSMQLSVKAHLTIYGDVKESDINKPSFIRRKLGLLDNKPPPVNESSLVEMKSELMKPATVRADLMKASGQVGLNKPYRAPIYMTYWECIQGLSKQGILGFYKGNALRVTHVFLYQLLRNDTQYYLDFGNNIFKRNSFFRDFAAATVASIFLHPLHLAEARFVLQNRLPNFQTYKSLWTLLMTSNKEFLRGITAHIPRNFILALTGFNYFSSVNLYTYLVQNLAFHTLAYPLLTIQRRLECQSTVRGGMLPLRYLGVIHGFGLMYREEGIKGLYRGYIAYLLAISLVITLVPLTSELIMLKTPFYGNYEDNDELYKEVMEKAKRKKQQ